MKPVTNSEVAIICPTKDRPKKISRLLNSIKEQTKLPGQIIISDTGTGNENILETYSDRLNILHLASPQKGQVQQRTYALSYLEKKIRVVISLDDDVTLEPTAIAQFLKTWNREQNSSEIPLGGVGFNVIDASMPKRSFLRNVMHMSSDRPGSVSPSGYVMTYAPAIKNIDTSFLLGGSSGWNRSVIENHPHPINFPTRWAFCEDIIFSYGIGKTHRLVVANNAHVKHNETYSDLSFAKAIYYGKTQVIMRYYLISLYDDLSLPAFLWMSFSQNIGYFLLGITGRKRFLGFAIGGIIALFQCLRTFYGNKSAKLLAVELYDNYRN